MIHSFQEKIAHNWYEHANGFDHVRDAVAPARRCYRWSQEVIEPKNVHHVEVPQSRAAKSRDSRIPAQGAVAQPASQIDRLDSAFFEAPPERRGLRAALIRQC